ncbi:MAG: energy transducer TonB [Bacteroidota bacterium]|nr:energy transducer TonB [Bacteroidota bacterium]
MTVGAQSTDERQLIAYDSPVLPSFPGGDAALHKFIKDNVHYPDSAKAHRIEGTVRIGFNSDTLGRLSDFVEKKGIQGYPEFTAEAIRVLKLSPNWNMKGVNEKTPVGYIQAFRFKLESNPGLIAIADSSYIKCGIQIPEAELGSVLTFTEVMPQFPAIVCSDILCTGSNARHTWNTSFVTVKYMFNL